MEFIAGFLSQSLWGAGFALLFFSLPGLWLAALLGLETRPHKNSSVLLIAPVLGLCGYGPFSLLFTWLFGYSVLSVLAAWLLFQGLAAVAVFKFPAPREALFEPRGAAWLLLGAALWGLIAALNIFPAVYQDGLFVNEFIFDHMKIALVDAIAREGMPPLNPFYAPAGERIELIYYYAWHFLGSQVRLLAGVSGWQAEVAMTWLTGFTATAFLAALAVRLSGRLRAGFAALLLALAGAPADLLSYVMGPRWERWVGYPPSHSAEVLWLQTSWAPQHVFAALSVVLVLFLGARALTRQDLRWSHAVAVGLSAAVGFGASIWVGGVALVLALPALLLALWRLRLDYARMWGPLGLALGVCVVFALPVLISVTSGPSAATQFPLAFKPYPTTNLFGHATLIQQFGHGVLFWLQFLPLGLGVVYVLGGLSLLAHLPRQAEARVLRALSLAAVLAYLLAVQFIQSVIANNDFGWRSVLVPLMLLHVWAALALAGSPRADWRPVAVRAVARWRRVLSPLLWAAMTVCVLSSFRIWHLPQPHPRHNPPNPAQLAWNQDFLRQAPAWAALRRHTAPGDLVQSNPDTYATVVTPWSGPAPQVLFGDRAQAYAEPESVNVFAHPYDKGQKAAQYAAVQALFAAAPGVAELSYARDTLRIKALLIDQRDPVWPGTAIESSGVYRLAEAGKHFKIYLAR